LHPNSGSPFPSCSGNWYLAFYSILNDNSLQKASLTLLSLHGLLLYLHTNVYTFSYSTKIYWEFVESLDMNGLLLRLWNDMPLTYNH
jgi:hypothetical protein